MRKLRRGRHGGLERKRMKRACCELEKHKFDEWAVLSPMIMVIELEILHDFSLYLKSSSRSENGRSGGRRSSTPLIWAW